MSIHSEIHSAFGIHTLTPTQFTGVRLLPHSVLSSTFSSYSFVFFWYFSLLFFCFVFLFVARLLTALTISVSFAFIRIASLRYFPFPILAFPLAISNTIEMFDLQNSIRIGNRTNLTFHCIHFHRMFVDSIRK